MVNSIRAEIPRLEPPLDVKELSGRCLGRLDLVEKVLHRFHETMDQELEQLANALREEDLKAIGCIAHRIKGTSLTVAAHGLRDCAQHLESAVQSNCLTAVEKRVSAIGDEWIRLSDMMSAGSLGTDGELNS